MMELSEPKTPEIIQRNRSLQILFVNGFVLVKQDRLGVQEIVKTGFDGNSLIEGCSCVTGIYKLLRIFLDIDFGVLHEGQDHLGSLHSHLLPLLILKVMVGEDILVVFDEGVDGFDVLVIVARKEEQLSQFVLIE